MTQFVLFAPALETCSRCGWSWRPGTTPPLPHLRGCVTETSSRPTCSPGAPSQSTNPVRRRGGVPLKKWRCGTCWTRFGRPREERFPVCRECLVGQATLFGDRQVLIPAEARPIRRRRRK